MLSLPDKGVGADNVQSIFFHEYLDVLVEGLNGINCVLFGCAVTAQVTPDMTVAVAKGAILSNGVLLPVTAGNVTIGTAHATLPRLDLIVADSTGAKQVRAGTAGSNPTPPTRTTNDVVLAVVFVPAADTTMGANQITDLRIVRGGIPSGGGAPVVVKKTTTPVTFNTTLAIQTYFTLTLPSGLMAAGQVLRCRCGGSYLMNSGTPLLTLTLAYGGTTMFADVSVVGAAATPRGGWYLDFNISCQSLTVQKLTGFITYQNTPAAGRVAPTSGVAGEMLGSLAVASRPVTTPLSGSAAVDSDAADRTLTVQWTMNTSNVADEMTMDFGTAELL
jgi:hypothetical protein